MKVAHLHRTFFIPSETFIYHAVTSLKRHDPVCVAREFVHGTEFPFPEGKKVKIGLGGVVSAKLFGFDLATEARLRRENVRLIHAHFGPNGFAALGLRRRLGVPLITTFYGYDISKLARHAAWQKRYHKLFREGELFLVEGECMKAKLLALGCPEAKIRVQRIAIPIDRIVFEPRTGARPIATLIFAGRFVEKKGLVHTLEALKLLRARRQDFEYRMIGDGALRPEIEAYVEKHAMRPYVKSLGFLKYGDYLKEMQAADIFLHPSVTASDGDDEGGAPTTILEAQAMGMPVVATRHADIPNVVVSGKSAFLSDERDVEGLALNLERLLADRPSWAVMGAEGRRFVEAYHDLPAGTARLETLYESFRILTPA